MFDISTPIARPQEWTVHESNGHEEGLTVRFSETRCSVEGQPVTRREVLERVKEILADGTTPWITLGFKEWILDLETLRRTFPELAAADWLRGRISLEP